MHAESKGAITHLVAYRTIVMVIVVVFIQIVKGVKVSVALLTICVTWTLDEMLDEAQRGRKVDVAVGDRRWPKGSFP